MREMNGDACELRAASLDFTRVDPYPNLETDLSGGVSDGNPATDRAGRSIEGGEHSVPG